MSGAANAHCGETMGMISIYPWCERCNCEPCACSPPVGIGTPGPWPVIYPMWPYPQPVFMPAWSPPQDVLRDAVAALVAAGVAAKDIEIVIRGTEALVRIRER